MPSEEALTAEGALPSSVFPSDHLPIQAQFKLDFTFPRIRLDNPTMDLIPKFKKSKNQKAGPLSESLKK
jgi:hypothetical protein